MATAYATSASSTHDNTALTSVGTTVAHGIHAGAYGAASIGLFFLAFDLLAREALWTPALVAGAIFEGGSATPAQIALAPVAPYSLLHAAIFGMFGIAVAMLRRRGGAIANPMVTGLTCLFALQIGVMIGAEIIEPGLSAAIGFLPLLLANALAAAAMVWSFTGWRR